MSKFNFNAPITDMTSYGLVALNVIQNIDCNVFPINHPSQNIYKNNPKKQDFIFQKIRNVEFDPSLPSVRLYHQFSLAESIGRDKRIGWPIFELDTFTDLEKSHLKSLDHIFVCSSWAKQIVIDNGINIPVDVVPLGVDRNIFHENINPENSNNKSNKRYTFLSCGKYEERKGQRQIVDAFNLAFNSADDVHLLISMHNQFMQKNQFNEVVKSFKETKLGDKISFIGPFETQEELARYMAFSDCGVFPSKAEGWGLETLEMMSCGNPVIVSDYSAHTEYCNNENSILIPVNETTVAYDGVWFHGQGKWAKIETDILVEKMRHAYKSRQLNPNGIKTAKEFSWQNTCEKIASFI